MILISPTETEQWPENAHFSYINEAEKSKKYLVCPPDSKKTDGGVSRILPTWASALPGKGLCLNLML